MCFDPLEKYIYFEIFSHTMGVSTYSFYVLLSAVPQMGFGWTKSAEPAQWTYNNKELIFPLKEGL